MYNQSYWAYHLGQWWSSSPPYSQVILGFFLLPSPNIICQFFPMSDYTAADLGVGGGVGGGDGGGTVGSGESKDGSLQFW